MDRYDREHLFNVLSRQTENQNGGWYITGQPYPLQLRQRVLSAVRDVLMKGLERHGIWSEIARHEKVSPSFVSKMKRLLIETSSVDDSVNVNRIIHILTFLQTLFGRLKGSINSLYALEWEDLEYVMLLIDQDPTIYLHELQQRLSEDLEVEVDVSTLCRSLNKLGITR
jgi:hypothetical protein